MSAARSRRSPTCAPARVFLHKECRRSAFQGQFAGKQISPPQPASLFAPTNVGMDGGEGGIRTHVPLRTTAFRVRLVATTSILLHARKNYSMRACTWQVLKNSHCKGMDHLADIRIISKIFNIRTRISFIIVAFYLSVTRPTKPPPVHECRWCQTRGPWYPAALPKGRFLCSPVLRPARLGPAMLR